MKGKLHISTRSILLLALLAFQASAQDRFLVRVRGGAAADFARNHSLTLLSSPDDPRHPQVGTLSPMAGSIPDLFVATLATGSPEVSAIRSDPAVQVEQDQPVRLPRTAPAGRQPSAQSVSTGTGSTMYYGSMAWSPYVDQPASGIVKLSQAHDLATGAGTVAFLDTGVDFTHPALSASLNFGWDFTTNVAGGAEIPTLDQSTTSILDADAVWILNQSTTSILDQSTTSILDQSTTSILDGTPAQNAYGHGTMIAGIIHLVAPRARLLPVKVFGNDGTANLSTILSGFYWAVDHGAKVINMSFSMTDYSQEFAEAVNYANSNRVIVVASAGNEGSDAILYPAGYQHTIGIGSTDNNDQRSNFSNYGDAVTVAAPGEGIISSYPGNRYAAGWGTSFSAPLVAGAAALLVELRDNINDSQAAKAIQQAIDIGQGLGAGRLDLYQACSYQASRGGSDN